MATVLVLAVLMLFMTGNSDGASWCACRTDVSESALQKALDYACGNGADCKPILQNGACFQPNTVRAHCSYAVNSYYQNKGQAQGTCIFSNSATVVQNDPSTGGTCTYPSSASSGGGNGGTTPGNGAMAPPGFPNSPPTGGFLNPPGFNSPPFSPGPSGGFDSNGVTRSKMLSVFQTLGFSTLLVLLMIV